MGLITGAENLTSIGIRSPDRPARSESLSLPTSSTDIYYLNDQLHVSASNEAIMNSLISTNLLFCDLT